MLTSMPKSLPGSKPEYTRESTPGSPPGSMPGRQPAVYCRGLSLFGALLALALLGMLVLAASTFFETLAAERRARMAARQLTILAEASASHVHGRFPALLTAARGGPVEITLAQLKSAGSLPSDFPAVDALGRGYRVLILAAGADALDVLTAETVEPGDPAAAGSAVSAALLEAAGDARLGVVAPDAPSRLAGPAVDHDVSPFQAAFAGAPAVGALAALRRFDHQAVYGGRLQRLAVPGFPGANRMETDLDMGGNAIAGAGRISAESLALSGDLAAGGDLAVTGDLTVGQAVRVAGTVEAAGAIRADTAAFAGAVSSRSLTVNAALRAASISATGTVTAGSVAAIGTVTAGGASLGRLTADTVSARTVTAGALAAASVRAMAVRATGHLDAATAGFSTLIVGRCTGCRP